MAAVTSSPTPFRVPETGDAADEWAVFREHQRRKREAPHIPGVGERGVPTSTVVAELQRSLPSFPRGLCPLIASYVPDVVVPVQWVDAAYAHNPQCGLLLEFDFGPQAYGHGPLAVRLVVRASDDGRFACVSSLSLTVYMRTSARMAEKRERLRKCRPSERFGILIEQLDADQWSAVPPAQRVLLKQLLPLNSTSTEASEEFGGPAGTGCRFDWENVHLHGAYVASVNAAAVALPTDYDPRTTKWTAVTLAALWMNAFPTHRLTANAAASLTTAEVLTSHRQLTSSTPAILNSIFRGEPSERQSELLMCASVRPSCCRPKYGRYMSVAFAELNDNDDIGDDHNDRSDYRLHSCVDVPVTIKIATLRTLDLPISSAHRADEQDFAECERAMRQAVAAGVDLACQPIDVVARWCSIVTPPLVNEPAVVRKLMRALNFEWQ